MKKLPSFLKQYFWDVDFNKINPEKSRMFILERILEHGNLKAINWLPKYYARDDIKKLIMTAKDLSPKTANFWAHYLNVDRRKIPALKNPPVRKIPVHLTSEYLNNTL